MTTHQVGSVLADRYELLDPLEGDPTADRYLALDRRLRREVVVEVERDGSSAASTAAGVRTFAGADDTGMSAVLDGGEAAGRHFVVREIPTGSFDDTGVIHAGPSTAVMDLPLLAPAIPAGAPSSPRSDGPRTLPRSWIVGVSAVGLALVVALALAAGGGPDVPPSVDPTTTVDVSTSPEQGDRDAVAVTTPSTEVSTTTVPDVVSDPETTDQFPEGVPFEETGPPGKAKKEPKGDKDTADLP